LKAGRELYDGGYVVDAAADVPLAPIAALRMAVHYNDTNGWVLNLATGRHVPLDKDLGLRATLALTPSEVFSAKLLYQSGDNKRIGGPYQIVDLALPAAFGEGVLNDTESEFTARTSSGDTEHRLRANILTAEVHWALAGQHALISQTSHVDYRLHFDDDLDFSVQPWIDFIRDERYQQFTQELRVASPVGGVLEYQGGLFYLHSGWHSLEQQLWGVPAFPPPPAPISGQLFNGPFTNDFDQKSESFSQFGQLSWRVSTRVTISAGLRHTRETKATLYGRTSSSPLTIWNTLANPPFAPTALPFADSFLDGNASVQFSPTQGVQLYASYGRGSKAGGYVETNSVAYPVPADPAVDSFIKSETARTFEFGLKSLLLQSRLRANLALFHTNITNFQDTAFTGAAAGFITENLPLRSRGVELESSWQASRGLRLSVAATYADSLATLTAQDFVLEPGVACQPCRAAQAPLWNGTAEADYSHAFFRGWNWRATLHGRYRGSMFNQRGEGFPTGPYRPLDASFGVETGNGRTGVSVSGKNLNNSLSEDFASPSVAPTFAGLASPAPLRTIWLEGWIHL
jgi:iron complex outermembrane receptor protein